MHDLWQALERDRAILHLLDRDQWDRAALLLVFLVVAFVALRPVAGRMFTYLALLTGLLGVQFAGTIAIGGAVAAAAVLVRLRRRPSAAPPSARAAVFEFSVLGAGLILYLLGRLVTQASWDDAHANAERLLAIEQALGLAIEDDVQHIVLRSRPVAELFGKLYSYVYLAALCGILVWLYLVDRREYRLMRNGMAISALLAVAVIGLIPMAPPRLLPESGLIDTVVAVEGRPHLFVNEYAAMPSVHVGWMALAGLALARAIGGWRGLLIGPLPGALTMITVIVTGNHFLLDGVIGSALALIPALLIIHTGGLAEPATAQPVRQGHAKPGAAARQRVTRST
jgi:hypothetical protein